MFYIWATGDDFNISIIKAYLIIVTDSSPLKWTCVTSNMIFHCLIKDQFNRIESLKSIERVSKEYFIFSLVILGSIMLELTDIYMVTPWLKTYFVKSTNPPRIHGNMALFKRSATLCPLPTWTRGFYKIILSSLCLPTAYQKEWNSTMVEKHCENLIIIQQCPKCCPGIIWYSYPGVKISYDIFTPG